MKRSAVVAIIAEVAAELGVRVVVEPGARFSARVELPDGRRRYMRDAVFDLNGAGATEVARDKDFASFFLRQSGFPVPEGRAFCTTRWARRIGSPESFDTAWRYAKQLGLPVIVKPNGKSQGSGVTLAPNKREFHSAVRLASTDERMYLVQRRYMGNDFRIVALDGDVISAYERVPLRVTGDGVRSIAELLQRRQDEFIARGRDTRLRIPDPRVTAVLRRARLTLDSVIEEGRELVLTDAANLSAGGEAIDRTNDLHPGWRQLAADIASEMSLRYVGVDVLTATPLSQVPGAYIILEVNAAPGLDHYAAVGAKQQELVRNLYERVLRALIDLP